MGANGAHVDSAHVDVSHENNLDIAAQPDSNSTDSIERIRDFLFGSRIVDQDVKLREGQELLRAENLAMKGELKAKISSLETFIRTEVDHVNRIQSSEIGELKEEVRKLENELQSQRHSFNALKNDHKQLIEQVARDARDYAVKESAQLAIQIGESTRDVFSEVLRIQSSLDSAKVNRSQLAAMFGELALTLDEQVAAPRLNITDSHERINKSS
jgi:FtsZ-binding cell division protein ZapB